jgi:tetratricopeptide (TPR) repeat protein
MQVQLIDGASEGHIWATTYDRQLTDIFAVQSDLAQSIVTALQASITPDEKAALEQPWTGNQQAFELYMKGANLWAMSLTKEGNLRAADHLDEATRLDTLFAAAYAMAAHVHTNIFTQGNWDSSPSRLQKAEAALRRARNLGPALPETHLAAGSYARHIKRDLGEAEREFESTLSLRPNDYEATHELAFVNVQLRRLDRALQFFERSEILNPLAPSGGMDSRIVAWAMRRWDEARRQSDRYIERLPGDPLAYGYHAIILMEGFGDFDGAARVLEQGEQWGKEHSWDERYRDVDVIGAIRAYRSYMRRDFPQAARLALKDLNNFGARRIPYNLLWGCRNEPGNRTVLDSILAQTTRSISRDSTRRTSWSRLAFLLAIRGKGTEARTAADRARSLTTSFDDPWMQQEIYLEWLANTYLLLGDHSTALDLLEDLLSRPSGMSIGKLRQDPIYDPLRNLPRFQALLAKNERM